MALDINPNSSGNRFREQRFASFLHLLARIGPDNAPLKILDVGGTMAYWGPRLTQLGSRPVTITLLNLKEMPVNDERCVSIAGDARDLSRFAEDHFDVVHSNSVIEHVGRWPDMKAMADEVRRVAPAHFVQTPNFWFPVEPHCRTLFYHWLPESWRLKLIMSRRLGFWAQAKDVDAGMRQLQGAVILDRKMFSYLFADSRIENEKFYGLTKSLIAVREKRAV